MIDSFYWFRRDLRLEDNTALFHALKESSTVQCVFIFDKNILDKLTDDSDARVSFIHQQIRTLKLALNKYGADLLVYYGDPLEVWKQIINESDPSSIYFNRDYEPYAIQRDQAVKALCKKHNVAFKGYKDHVIFEGHEVLKADHSPYVVFTPYSKQWKLRLKNESLQRYIVKDHIKSLAPVQDVQDDVELKHIGFKQTNIPLAPVDVSPSLLKHYHDTRDYPGIEGTTRLSVHLRFGTVSIRELVEKATQHSEIWLNELIWRDFYSMMLTHFPHVVDQAFRPKYDEIKWRWDADEFKRWCEGETGYPLVDAGMRQLNETGWMHNRVRMVVASFLTKHLLIDWRKGEAYFAEKLIDYDMASNIGGWQWAAGCGADAAPYFRIFNPHTQFEKFDKGQCYVKKWVPEYGSSDYISEVVDHKMARERCLKTYKATLNATP